MVDQAITGELKNAEFTKDEMFGLNIPKDIEGVPQTILNPINAWSKPEEYKEQAQDLISRFKDNFAKFGEEAEDIAQAGGFE